MTQPVKPLSREDARTALEVYGWSQSRWDALRAIESGDHVVVRVSDLEKVIAEMASLYPSDNISGGVANRWANALSAIIKGN